MHLVQEMERDPSKRYPCLLCGVPETHATAVFNPFDGGICLGAPNRKQRVVIYCLCNDCMDSPNVAQRCEDACFEHARLIQ